MNIVTSEKSPLHVKGATGAVAVTPSDTADLTKTTRGLYVGASGDVKATLQDGDVVTFTALSAGQIHPICAKRIHATGTTATGILAVY